MNETTARVIVVEDEPQIRRFVRTTLESEGCAVAEAETAARGRTNSLVARRIW